jgi:hypothetical protein
MTNSTKTQATTATSVKASLSEIFHCSQILIPFDYIDAEGESVSDYLQISTDLDNSKGIFDTFSLTFSYSKGKLYQLNFNTLVLSGKPISKKVTQFSITKLIDDSLSSYLILNNNDDQRLSLLIYLLRECIEKDLTKSEQTGLLIFKPISKTVFKEQIAKIASELEAQNIAFQSHFKVLKSFIDSKAS